MNATRQAGARAWQMWGRLTGMKQWAGAAAAAILFLIGAVATPVQASVSVTLTAPPNGAVYNAPASITLSATASAGQGYTLSKVEFFHGGTNLIATDTTAPYSFNWTNVPAGTYTITAVATAVKKNSPNETATSAPATITVNALPSVSMTSPSANAVYGAPASVTLTANASDSDGTISKVEFFHGGTNLIATVTSAPYTYNWTGVTAGSYSLTAVATDNRNATTTSSAVPITVTTPPSVTMTSPANNAAFAAPANVTLTATASDSDGSIQKVEFFHGGTNLIATVTSAPYTYNWTGVTASSYSLTAVATDNLGIPTTSSPVAINVTAAPTVTLTSPTSGATFDAPASINLTATASDPDGSIQKVEFFHGGTNLIATVTTPPYTFNWQNVQAGGYSLTAVATDNFGIPTTSAPVSITVNQVAALYFIHTDQLNTPRLITNNVGQAVWQWANDDPFGNNAPNENPSGLGTFTCNLRLPGQYFDKETNLHYNYFRDYDPAIGRYIQSDPIGLLGGINTYVYAYDPLTQVDPRGLMGRASGTSVAKSVPKVRSVCGTGVFTGPAFSFTEACEAHDRCYDTCGANRFVCDDNFSRQAHSSCPPGDVMCHSLAITYYTLMKFGGMVWSFDAAQREACQGSQCR